LIPHPTSFGLYPVPFIRIADNEGYRNPVMRETWKGIFHPELGSVLRGMRLVPESSFLK
jgi:hypothetical protein